MKEYLVTIGACFFMDDYFRYKGHQPGYGGDGTQADRDNHANQMNPNNPK